MLEPKTPEALRLVASRIEEDLRAWTSVHPTSRATEERMAFLETMVLNLMRERATDLHARAAEIEARQA